MSLLGYILIAVAVPGFLLRFRPSTFRVTPRMEKKVASKLRTPLTEQQRGDLQFGVDVWNSGFRWGVVAQSWVVMVTIGVLYFFGVRC